VGVVGTGDECEPEVEALIIRCTFCFGRWEETDGEDVCSAEPSDTSCPILIDPNSLGNSEDAYVNVDFTEECIEYGLVPEDGEIERGRLWAVRFQGFGGKGPGLVVGDELKEGSLRWRAYIA
jgi:hypothetical protein